jgi:hypothetical protein
VDGNAAITKALAGGLDLNARLTELERGFGESRAELNRVTGISALRIAGLRGPWFGPGSLSSCVRDGGRRRIAVQRGGPDAQ